MRIQALTSALLLFTTALAFAEANKRSDSLLTVNVGAGPQPGASQTNRSAGIDFEFWQYHRSPRQQLSLGVSYTYLHTSTGRHNNLHAFSLYPQLTLRPSAEGWANKLLPTKYEPYFFVRALGPSYISNNRLGERRQSEHFAFQAQVGIGATFTNSDGRKQQLSIAWKHFSNANLFDDNDGIDVPLVLSYGTRF